jgi:HlyD family secretion protein
VVKPLLLSVAAAVAGATALALFARPGARGAAAGGEALVVTGTVEAREVDVANEVGGRIVSLEADEGAAVRRGDLLAVLDDAEPKLRVERLEARARAAEAELADLRSLPRREDVARERSRVGEAEVALDAARATLARARLAKELVAKEQLDDRASAHRAAAQALETARCSLAALEAGARPAQLAAAESHAAEAARDLDLARLDLARTRVTAPIGGTVLRRNFEVGEHAPAGSPLFTIVDLSDQWVELAADERLHGRIVLGARAEVRPEAAGGAALAGRVTFVADRHAFTPRDAQTRDERSRLCYRVKVKVESPPAWLKPGMFADVAFGAEPPPVTTAARAEQGAPGSPQ